MAQLLLSQNDIPRLTALSGNIDIDKLTPFVFQAQILDGKRILGTDLFNKILTDFTNDNLSGDYATIYNDYLIFIIAYYASSYYVKLDAYQINNNGGKKSNDSENYRQLGITFETQLLEFLKENDVAEYVKENATTVKAIKPWY